jgi:hypothetical protein
MKNRLDVNNEGSEIPDQYAVGDNLDWTAPWEEVTLIVELPFWLMVPDCTVPVEIAGHSYNVAITEHYCQVYGRHITDSLDSCAYIGPFPPTREVEETILISGIAALLRKCKTVLLISSRCNSDVYEAVSEEDAKRNRSAQMYLNSLCSAHIPIVNRILRAYALQTYDPGAHEVAPWDVPIWFVKRKDGQGIRTIIQESANWDSKPQMFQWEDLKRKEPKETPFQFASADDLRDGLLLEWTPGEVELAQGMHLRERGDYSGAVRRSVTSLEILLEARLRRELTVRFSSEEVERSIRASRGNFPARLQQYQALSCRKIPDPMGSELDRIRELRHDIVHRGRWLTFVERDVANRAVDTTRFIFNWLEDSEESRKRRDRLLVQRQLGMHLAVFPAELTSEGVVVRGFK